jgi:hypothetical protein
VLLGEPGVETPGWPTKADKKSRIEGDYKTMHLTMLSETTMNTSTQRTIFRWIHIIFGIPILGYIYSPFEKLPDYAPATRFVFLPVIVLTGLWMWKGHLVRRLISKGSVHQDAARESDGQRCHATIDLPS